VGNCSDGETKEAQPQNGDRVSVRGEKGTFVVYSVNSMVEAVNVKLMARITRSVQ